MQGLAGKAVALLLEVGEQGGLLAGDADEIDQRVDVLDEDGAEVADQRVVDVVVGRV